MDARTPVKEAKPLVTLKTVCEEVGSNHDLSKKQVDGF